MMTGAEAMEEWKKKIRGKIVSTVQAFTSAFRMACKELIVPSLGKGALTGEAEAVAAYRRKVKGSAITMAQAFLSGYAAGERIVRKMGGEVVEEPVEPEATTTADSDSAAVTKSESDPGAGDPPPQAA